MVKYFHLKSIYQSVNEDKRDVFIPAIMEKVKEFVMSEEVKEAISIAGDAGSFVPLVQAAANLIKKIIEICEAADYNQNICDTLVVRVKITSAAMESLHRRKKKRKELDLPDEVFHDAFHRFIYILEEIKEFTTNISKIHGFKKYTKALSVKDKFISLTEKYDKAMIDLHFTMAVANDEQREIEKESLEEDIAEFEKYLKKMEQQVDSIDGKVDVVSGKVNKIDEKVNYIYDEIMFIKNKAVLHGASKIDSKDLVFPSRGKSDNARGKAHNVMKRIYKGQEVACKKISMSEEEMKSSPDVQKLLTILTKLSDCNHILKFYGVSKIGIDNIMVFEWAELETLKELYEKKDINWHCKVRIALNICRGLIFLQQAEILHHDLKCENILMTQAIEPKIYNFESARFVSGKTTTLGNEFNDTVRWMAPEKLSDPKTRYTSQCEIFSFGMLLWELAFEKVPYKKKKVEEIKEYVTKGGREIIRFGKSASEIPKLQEEYKKIINDSWKQDPHERISFLKILDMLEELHSSIIYLFDENLPNLLPDKTLDLDGTNEPDDDYDDLEIPDDVCSIISITLEEGIKAYRASDHQKAWKCFEYHANNGNVTAKYWKGRYLYEGLHNIKNLEEGKKLLKEAADEGNPDAQLRYAFTLLKILEEGNNKEIFMNYLTKSATEGENSAAQFHLGDIYYKGKCKIPKDENKGIEWLRKAALKNNNKAIKLLEDSNIKILS
ncbi:hypothetical protein RclHR1_01810012 [Rhizophagus clarus]|uniref:Protein kinase domain-containing protein n=1 Tax=Rhizophagus clarus TaxID=94130 RepID=A0A2Z6QZ01_9GLOM|nr:hypothetical protein RclHR1_01810012 [Rhizophagus clarus]